MKAIKVAIDSAIFFFCFRSDREDIKPINMQKLLNHLSTAPHILFHLLRFLYIGESVIECLRGERENSEHDLDGLHELIDFWGALELARKRKLPRELQRRYPILPQSLRSAKGRAEALAPP